MAFEDKKLEISVEDTQRQNSHTLLRSAIIVSHRIHFATVLKVLVLIVRLGFKIYYKNIFTGIVVEIKQRINLSEDVMRSIDIGKLSSFPFLEDSLSVHAYG